MAMNQTDALGQASIPAPTNLKAAGELARRKIYAGIPDDDVALALAICQKYGFDPLLKHLVLIASSFKDESTGQWLKRYNAYVTRDGLVHVAHTSGMLDGLEVNLGKDDLGEWAEATVYRKDMSRPFRYRVYLSEYTRDPRGAWKTHPQAMLTKTAEVFALRRAFDVALTPVEEMGFEETRPSLLVDEAGPEARGANVPRSAPVRNTGEIHWLDDETAVVKEAEATDTRPALTRHQEQSTPYPPRGPSQETPREAKPTEVAGYTHTRATGSNQATINPNTKASSNGNQRRRLI